MKRFERKCVVDRKIVESLILKKSFNEIARTQKGHPLWLNFSKNILKCSVSFLLTRRKFISVILHSFASFMQTKSHRDDPQSSLEFFQIQTSS